MNKLRRRKVCTIQDWVENREICSRAVRFNVRAVLVVGWFYESEVEWQGLERIWKFKWGATLLDRQRVKPTFKSKWLTTFQTPFHWLALKVAHQKSIFGISFLNGGGGVTFNPFLFLDSKVSEKTSIHSGFFQMVFAEGGFVNGEETPALMLNCFKSFSKCCVTTNSSTDKK